MSDTPPPCPQRNSVYAYEDGNLCLVDGDHNIDCKVTGIGAIMLKSEFVKKA